MESKLIILGQDREVLEIKVLGRSNPGAENYHDANWLDATISIEVPAFGGIYHACLYTTDFPRFFEGIMQIKKGILQEAEFSTIEDSLFIHIKQEKLGTLIVSGRTDTKLANVLHFKFKADNMQLDYIANQLQILMKQYPVIGRS